ncbi:MAG: integrase core domain-containing protein [Acidimicrobiales bacterium]
MPSLSPTAAADSFTESDTVFIDPGSPGQSGWNELFNGRLRAEFVNSQFFGGSPLEVQALSEKWRIKYEVERSHCSHGFLTPAARAAMWNEQFQLSFAKAVNWKLGSGQHPGGAGIISAGGGGFTGGAESKFE